MKVLIAAVITSEHISGVSRHAVNMVRCQLTRPEISEIHLVVGSWQYEAFRSKTAVTLHDLYPYDFPDNFGFLKMMFNRMQLRQCLRAVDAVACVSESTLRRLDMHMPDIARLKAATVYNCVDPGPAMASRSPIPAWTGEPFFLCVAQHRRNKNIVLGMQVFQQLLRQGDISSNTRLVIIGIEGPETPLIRRFIHDNGLEPHVVLLHGIGDAEMEWCY